MKSASDLELMLFENSRDGARAVLPFGITSFLLDWELLGKGQRQNGFDTEIQPVGVEELAAVSSVPGAVAWCRINQEGPHTPDEIERALNAGARGIFLPMATSAKQVERFLRRIDGRCGTGILIETEAALACAAEIAMLSPDRVYFGLNDFAISRGGGPIFRALLDGSVERAREAFAGTDFGFGGITAVDAGYPVPCTRLIEEMARMDCQFSFLRRSFRSDVVRVGAAELTRGVREHWRRCRERGPDAIQRDHLALERILREVCNA